MEASRPNKPEYNRITKYAAIYESGLLALLKQ